MKINIDKLPIGGAYALTAFSASDSRGSLSKYLEYGLAKSLGFEASEVLVSKNRKNAIRGLHYQHPGAQQKIVWCTRGKVYEVLLDLRKQSPTFGKWHALTLSAELGNGVYVPKGVAHGFASVEEGSELLYIIGGQQSPKSERGVRFDDPKLAIGWPVGKKEAILSEKDKSWPAFSEAEKF